MMYWNEKHAECICQDCILRGSLKERYSTHTKDYSVGSIQHVYGSSAMKANLLYHTLYLPPWSFCMISMILHALPAAWILSMSSHGMRCWCFPLTLQHRIELPVKMTSQNKPAVLKASKCLCTNQIRTSWMMGERILLFMVTAVAEKFQINHKLHKRVTVTFCFEQASSDVPSDIPESGYFSDVFSISSRWARRPWSNFRLL